MKNALCVAMSLALCTTSAFADSSALASGKPAGVREAQYWNTNTISILSAIALGGVAIALAATAGNAGGPTTSTSTGTAP